MGQIPHIAQGCRNIITRLNQTPGWPCTVPLARPRCCTKVEELRADVDKIIHTFQQALLVLIIGKDWLKTWSSTFNSFSSFQSTSQRISTLILFQFLSSFSSHFEPTSLWKIDTYKWSRTVKSRQHSSSSSCESSRSDPQERLAWCRKRGTCNSTTALSENRMLFKIEILWTTRTESRRQKGCRGASLTLPYRLRRRWQMLVGNCPTTQ